MQKNIILRTAAQDFYLEAMSNLTLEELLRTKRLPPNLFQGYLESKGEITPVPLHSRIDHAPLGSTIILQCVRNTDLRQVLPQKTYIKKTENPTTTYSSIEIGHDGCSQTIFEVNSDQAKGTVKNKIADFMETYSKQETVLVGISGGGDSNTLAESLKKLSKPNKRFIFYTIVFDPLWPQTAANRASELCNKIGEKHEIYDSSRIESLLSMKGELLCCYQEFLKTFGDNTDHFFGTYLISLVGRALCKRYETKEYILGFNREDLLAELLFSIMNGQSPLSFPVRKFGDTLLLMPLWEIPKLILDACYPKFSLSNYSERDKFSTFQRNIIYYLAHSIEDAYDNLGLSIMRGVNKLFEDNWAELSEDSDFDLYPSVYAEESKKLEIKMFLKKFFPPNQKRH